MTPEDFEKALWQSRSQDFVAIVNMIDDDKRKALNKVVKSVRKEVKKVTDQTMRFTTNEEWNRAHKQVERWKKKTRTSKPISSSVFSRAEQRLKHIEYSDGTCGGTTGIWPYRF